MLFATFSGEVSLRLPQIKPHGNQEEDEAYKKDGLRDSEFLVFVGNHLHKGILRLGLRSDVCLIDPWGKDLDCKIYGVLCFLKSTFHLFQDSDCGCRQLKMEGENSFFTGRSDKK